MGEEVSRLEKRVDKLELDVGGLRSTIADLQVTLALLNQTLNQLRQVEEKRSAAKDRTIMFIVGGFITAIIAWIVRGGLGS
jgi:prefoldin subunit 5